MITENGKLFIKGAIQSGISQKSGNQWQRQQIIIEVPGYQGSIRRIALNVSTREIDDVAAIPVGTNVTFSYQVSAREYNGKWYNDVELYRIAPVNAQAAASAPAPAVQNLSAPQAPETFQAQTDDLPFD